MDHMAQVRKLHGRRVEIEAAIAQIDEQIKSEGRVVGGPTEFVAKGQLKKQIAAIDDMIGEINKQADAERAVLARRMEAHRKGDPIGGAGVFSGTGAPGGGNGGFANVGEMLAALYRKDRGEGLDSRLEALRVVALGGTDSGGYAVPEQFVAATFDKTEQLDDGIVLLNQVDRVTMTSDKMTAPAFVDNTHASSPYGIGWQQVAESGAFPDEIPTLRSVELNAHKSGALFAIPNEWLADSATQMQARLESVFRRSLRWYVESLLWNGTGAGEALGALTGAGRLEVATVGGQAANTIVVENLLAMYARAIPGTEGRLIWVANKTTLPQLAAMTLVSGTGGNGVGLLRQDATAPLGFTLLGRPLYWSEHLPSLGTSGDIVLLDPMHYVLGDRQQIVIDTSAHLKFNYDQTVFRAKARFDGQPVLNTTFTPKNGNTCGWAVVLADR